MPYAGFSILRRWAKRRPLGYFVFTGNVVTGPIDSLAVTVSSPGGQRTHHFLGLYWPEELRWCAEILAQASGRPP